MRPSGSLHRGANGGSCECGWWWTPMAWACPETSATCGLKSVSNPLPSKKLKNLTENIVADDTFGCKEECRTQEGSHYNVGKAEVHWYSDKKNYKYNSRFILSGAYPQVKHSANGSAGRWYSWQKLCLTFAYKREGQVGWQGGRRGRRRVVNAHSHLNTRENERLGGEHIATSLAASEWHFWHKGSESLNKIKIRMRRNYRYS